MKILIRCFTLILCATTLAQGEIVDARSIKEVRTHLEESVRQEDPKGLFVVFDVDFTILQSVVPAGHRENLQVYAGTYAQISPSLTPEQQDGMRTRLFLGPQRFVEKEVLSLIQDLQQQDVKTIGITQCLSGKRGDPKNKYLFQRRDQLQKMGLDFKNPRVVTDVGYTLRRPKHYAGGTPLFYHGLLGTNGQAKGPVLVGLFIF